jgi:hypothetical protein
MIEESSEDRDQLARAAAGDQEALRQLFSRYRHHRGKDSSG